MFQHPGERRILAVGTIVNLGVAVVWAMSRTTGDPDRPHPLDARESRLAQRDGDAQRARDRRNRSPPARLDPGFAERIEWGTRAIAIPLLAATLLAGSLTHEH